MAHGPVRSLAPTLQMWLTVYLLQHGRVLAKLGRGVVVHLHDIGLVSRLLIIVLLIFSHVPILCCCTHNRRRSTGVAADISVVK